jgi:hypothetical protein
MAMKAMQDTYGMVLREAALENHIGGNCGKQPADNKKEENKVSSPAAYISSPTIHSSNSRVFTSSNLDLDMYKKSNKRIRPMGERGNKRKK